MKRLRTTCVVLVCLLAFGISLAQEEMVVFAYQDDVAFYLESGKLGLIDVDQNRLTEPLFVEVMPFYDRVAVVKNENGYWGIIDKSGAYVFAPTKTKSRINFFDGYAAIELNGSQYTIINKQGDMLFTPKQYQWITYPLCGYFGIFEQGVMRFADFNGKIAFGGEDWIEISGFSENLSPVRKDETWGYINTDGDLVIDYQYAEANSFSNGLASVWIKGNTHYSYINTKGEVVLDGPWEEAGRFGEYDLAPVMVGDLWGYINMSGDMVLPPTWRNATEFDSGLAAVEEDYFKGYIDQTGQYVIDPIWRNGSRFQSGYAYVFQGDEGSGYINTSGELICWFQN